MSKVYGKRECYHPIRRNATQIIVSYEMEAVDETYGTWYEVYFNKKQTPSVTIDMVKDVIIADINVDTDEKILSGFVWNGIHVWLSSENQFNFKAAYDLAVQTQGLSLPIKFKLGEDENGNPVYHTFEDMMEFTDFYTKAIAYINKCLNDGWELKDSIDYEAIEQML